MDAKQLQQSLVPGDLIIATEDAYFENGKISQTKGDILMVNNPRIGDLIVGGTGLNGVAYNGRKCLGLCRSFRVGTFVVLRQKTRVTWLHANNGLIGKIKR